MTNELSRSLFGYNRNEVQLMLYAKNERLTTLENQVNNLEGKIKELETSLDKYRSLEQALQAGIVDARLKGEEIIEDSNLKASHLIRHTNNQVNDFRDVINHHSHAVIDRGLAMKDSLHTMKEEMYQIIGRFNQLLDETDVEAIYPLNQQSQLDETLAQFNENHPLLDEKVGRSFAEESSLDEAEQRELESLIHEVITNEEAMAEEVDASSEEVSPKFVDLRVIQGN